MGDGQGAAGGAVSRHGKQVEAVTAIYLQDQCYRHRYIRSRNTSSIYERPERLRAINVGISAAVSRLEELVSTRTRHSNRPMDFRDGESSSNINIQNDLPVGIDAVNLASDRIDFLNLRLSVVRSLATDDMVNHLAATFVHDPDPKESYLEKLAKWALNSENEIAVHGCEIPEHLSDTDLYLCPGTVDAIEGSIGAVCQAVDDVMASAPSSHTETPSSFKARRAFVVIRPPGHHCEGNTPEGFCFVNNVAVAAAQAFISYNINHVVIFDIDLHHGNGTQVFAQEVNEDFFEPEVYSSTLDGRALRIYYGSIHDILSYPCEDGDPYRVEAASLKSRGEDGQYIENIHLKPYKTEEFFWDVLYEKRYSRLFTEAEAFIRKTGATNDVLVLISCGFDASEHELPDMLRHDRKVPASFFYRFTKDAVAFAKRYANGRIISILEGGYSDRALISGAMAHVCGLADTGGADTAVDENWWSVENLVKLEQVIKKRRGRPRSTPMEPWIERTKSILSAINSGDAKPLTRNSSSPSDGMSTPSIPMTPPARRTPPFTGTISAGMGMAGSKHSETLVQRPLNYWEDDDSMDDDSTDDDSTDDDSTQITARPVGRPKKRKARDIDSMDYKPPRRNKPKNKRFKSKIGRIRSKPLEYDIIYN